MNSDRSADTQAAVTMGLMTAIAHIFNCLHYRGVLSREEAVQSLRETADQIPPGSPAAKLIVETVAKLVEWSGHSQGEPPPGPTAPIRPTLTVIQGGRSA